MKCILEYTFKNKTCYYGRIMKVNEVINVMFYYE